MHLRDRIRCLDFFIKKVSATRNSTFSHRVMSSNRIAVKREVKHSIVLPKKKKDSFEISVKDRLAFGRAQGPFSIEITVGGVIYLTEEMEPREIASMLKDKENINFLINQSLPYSCATIAYLTDRMGFSPIILAPKSPSPEG